MYCRQFSWIQGLDCKKMKKRFLILFLIVFPFCLNAVENSYVTAANRNTALRCLKLAENCLVGNDWENASRQADLGLSYDDSISDLIYMKAAAQINMGYSRSEIIKLITIAFEKDNWVGYSKNGARILYADLLSDTGLYEMSMKVLDEPQMIFSADAEFIRVKNLYRMGTEASINSARLKLNSARRVYPSDSRFPNIFFMFEFVYLLENEKVNNKYEVPEVVNVIASYYINKLPDYSGNNLELELLASFFANDNERVRIVNAIDAKNQTVNPVLAIAGMDAGLYDDQKACDLFFEMSGDSISLELLQILVSRIDDITVKQLLMEKMLNFTGIIEVDENFDLQNELIIEYELGRPKTITYDGNNDGIIDLYADCDFGAPNFIRFEKNLAEYFYYSYPAVSTINYNTENHILHFLQGEYTFAPVYLVPEKYLQQLGLDFYIPFVSYELTFADKESLLDVASSIELPVKERENAKVIYSLKDGQFISADFYENNIRYAWCDFVSSSPVSRYADYDFDGYFETLELYDLVEVESSLYDRNLIKNNFGDILEDYPLYLKQILIDRNGNTFYEFTEQYLENNGKVNCWDNDDDGIVDCQYTKYPQYTGENLLEETVYFDGNGNPFVKLTTIDGVPVKITEKSSEVMIYAGSANDFYWIDQTGDVNLENAVIKKYRNQLQQGSINFIEIDDTRLSVILVGKSIYCNILPDSQIEESEQPDDVSDIQEDLD